MLFPLAKCGPWDEELLRFRHQAASSRQFGHGPRRRQTADCALRLGTEYTVRTGNYNHITIGIAHPHFTVLGRRVDVRFFDNFGPQPASALHDRVKVVDLEPQQDTVSRRRRIGVDEIGVVCFVPSVDLKNQSTGVRDPLVQVAVALQIPASTDGPGRSRH